MKDLRLTLLPAFTFTGAFLMFMLEPLVGRILLPAYGGGFHVWTTCLMFFQGALLAGYLYAHYVAPRIGRWHLLVACLPLALLPIDVVPSPDPGSPILSILTVLVARIAVPFGVLSTTGVTAQSWLARSADDRRSDPYWLYAASNAGSLLGLLAYPFAVEPWLGVTAQRWSWSVLYVAYLVLAAVTAPRSRVGASFALPESSHSLQASASSKLPVAAWLALSTATSMMLMAVTNALSFDVGSIPLVWVAPLALYLATFVLIFGKTPLYPRVIEMHWPEAALGGLIALAAAPLLPSWPRVGLHLLALFATCMAAHAELHRLRPQAAALTKYYLVMSVGGWLGGVFVSLAAPQLFDRLLEYPIALLLTAGSLVTCAHSHRGGRSTRTPAFAWQAAVRAPLTVTALALISTWLGLAGSGSTRLAMLRNHYGVYQIGDVPQQGTGPDSALTHTVRQIVHNGTIHGAQITDESLRHVPIGYYHHASGLGDVMSTLTGAYKLGVIGLGAGATAAYLDADDEVVFYEIDPDDETLARRWFTYLADCAGKARVVIGDARLTLASDANAPDGAFDAFLVDAFSGDAIPTHLLTREALELYLRKLRPGGVLLFHVTNRFYDLRPVLEAASRALGLHSAYRDRPESEVEPFERHTVYWAMSSDRSAIEHLAALGWSPTHSGAHAVQPATLWTDDYVNVLAPLWHGLLARDEG